MSKIYLQGPVVYPKIFEGTREREGFEGQYKPHNGMYECPIGLDAADYAEVKKWNKRYEGKEYGEDKGGVLGLKYITFKRKHEHRKKNGELIEEWSGPPKVFDADGNEWDPTIAVGNGSVVTVELEVTKQKGKPTTFVRLEKVRIDEHVPYESAYEDVEAPESSKDVIPF